MSLFIEKYKIYLFIGYTIAIFLLGYVIGHNNKVNKSVVNNSSKETYHSELLIPGKPDTNYKSVQLELNSVIKKEDPTVNYGPVIKDTGSNNNRPAWSQFTREFTNHTGSIHVGVTTYPGVDSAIVSANYNGFQREIKQTDTLVKKDSIKSNIQTTELVGKDNYWSISAGISRTFSENNDYSKYVDLNYIHKVWFFNVAAGAGICNGYNDGVKNIQTHLKLELNYTF